MTIARTIRVGKRHVTFACPAPTAGGALAIEVTWQPTAPKKLTGAELRQYRRARDEAIAQLADELARLADAAALEYSGPPLPGHFHALH